MSESEQTRQLNYVLPPRAGNVVAITVSTTASAIQLSTFDNQTQSAAQQDQLRVGANGVFITVEADGADLGIIFGPTLASVTGANAPVLATVGTVTAGVYAAVAGTCYRIPSTQNVRFKLAQGTPAQGSPDAFLGFVGSAAGTIRIFRSSPYQC